MTVGTLPVKKPLVGRGLGEDTTPQKSMPVTKAAAGHVMIQPPKMTAKSLQLTASMLPLHIPTATVAPEMQCVVDTGIPTFEATMTVNMAPSSMQKPRDGDVRVSRLPSAAMMW